MRHNFLLAVKSYVSMKSLSESRMSLDIPPINARVKLTFHSFMSRAMKKLSALSVLFSLEFLSLGFFSNGTFARSTQYVPPRLVASETDVKTAKLKSLSQSDTSLFKGYGELTPGSGSFLIAKENAKASLRRFVVFAGFSAVILAPKVSLYIFKSVLNL